MEDRLAGVVKEFLAAKHKEEAISIYEKIHCPPALDEGLLQRLRKMNEVRTHGIRVYETRFITKEVQVRTHRKKRINKKWRKRYGMKRVEDPTKMVLAEDGFGGKVLYVHPKMAQKIQDKFVKTLVDDRMKSLYGL